MGCRLPSGKLRVVQWTWPMSIEIVDLHTKNCDFPWETVNLPKVLIHHPIKCTTEYEFNLEVATAWIPPVSSFISWDKRPNAKVVFCNLAKHKSVFVFFQYLSGLRIERLPITLYSFFFLTQGVAGVIIPAKHICYSSLSVRSQHNLVRNWSFLKGTWFP